MPRALRQRLLPARLRATASAWLGRTGLQLAGHYTGKQFVALDYRGQNFIRLDYPTAARNEPRWDPHPELNELIGRHETAYRRSLETIAGYREPLAEIALHSEDPAEPSWINGWLPGLDSAAIYAFLRARSPALYLEIGSGNSTLFAHKARRDGALPTRIISIDPHPRAEIDAICDHVVRAPLEAADQGVFGDLRDGDILFFDGSHRTFMNSDVTVFFCEVLPRLPAGVLVGVHDIYLPFDYPQEFADRYYSEQYMLAAHLLAGNPAIEPVLAAWYVSVRREFGDAIAPLWSHPRLHEAEGHGGAFWWVTRNAAVPAPPAAP